MKLNFFFGVVSTFDISRYCKRCVLSAGAGCWAVGGSVLDGGDTPSLNDCLCARSFLLLNLLNGRQSASAGTTSVRLVLVVVVVVVGVLTFVIKNKEQRWKFCYDRVARLER